MPTPSEQTIREHAYRLWEQDGRPDGRAEDFWQRAEHDLAGLDGDDDARLLAGESTEEGDILNDTTPSGGVDPRQRGRTNQ